MSFLDTLPAPKQKIPQSRIDVPSYSGTIDPLAIFSSQSGTQPVEKNPAPAAPPKRKIPPYGKRKGWIPRSQEDFGDGGAYPEVHVAQYPLGMGFKGKSADSSTSKTLALTLDSSGNIQYDSVINPGGKKKLFSKFEDAIASYVEQEQMLRPDEEEQLKIAEDTRRQLEKIVETKIAAAQPANPGGIENSAAPTFIKYTPSSSAVTGTMQHSGRIIRLNERPVDPLEPPKFKHKKMPKGGGSPPAPVMHSPPRKMTLEDQQDWKLPPCISNWKNNKGYTISLDKRLAADGRGLIEVKVNDNFAKLSESLYIAERTAREEVAKRAEIEKLLQIKEKEKKEEMLRKLAEAARTERITNDAADVEGSLDEEEGRREREQMMEERRREIERDLRLQRNKSKYARNADRDIGEKVALGMAVGTGTSETLFDARLFNQTEGLDSGFGEDDSYNVYTKPLFHQNSSSFMYKGPSNANNDPNENYGTEEDYQKLLDTSKFKADKGFSGTDKKREETRSRPVEFEKSEASSSKAGVEEDPYGFDALFSAATNRDSKSSKMNAVLGGGGMKVASANYETAGNTKRGRLDFEAPKESEDKEQVVPGLKVMKKDSGDEKRKEEKERERDRGDRDRDRERDRDRDSRRRDDRDRSDRDRDRDRDSRRRDDRDKRDDKDRRRR